MFGAIVLTVETAHAQLDAHAPKLPAAAREAVASALYYRATATVEPGEEVRVYPNRSRYVIERLTALGFVRVRGREGSFLRWRPVPPTAAEIEASQARLDAARAYLTEYLARAAGDGGSST